MSYDERLVLCCARLLLYLCRDKHDGGEASSSREAAGANCITEFEMSSLELETNLRED